MGVGKKKKSLQITYKDISTFCRWKSPLLWTNAGVEKWPQSDFFLNIFFSFSWWAGPRAQQGPAWGSWPRRSRSWSRSLIFRTNLSETLWSEPLPSTSRPRHSSPEVRKVSSAVGGQLPKPTRRRRPGSSRRAKWSRPRRRRNTRIRTDRCFCSNWFWADNKVVFWCNRSLMCSKFYNLTWPLKGFASITLKLPGQ